MIKLLNVVDEFTREALEMLVQRGIDADTAGQRAGPAGGRARSARASAL